MREHKIPDICDSVEKNWVAVTGQRLLWANGPLDTLVIVFHEVSTKNIWVL